MFATIMKWVSIAALLLAAAFRSSALDYQVLLRVVVFMGSIVVFQQAFQQRQYHWMAAFAAVALLFNPVAPVFQAAGSSFLLIVFGCSVLFVVSALTVRTQPLLSIPSITDRTPGSESL